MRISDWVSDVCSSDLGLSARSWRRLPDGATLVPPRAAEKPVLAERRLPAAKAQAADIRPPISGRLGGARFSGVVAGPAAGVLFRPFRIAPRHGGAEDRKSVV